MSIGWSKLEFSTQTRVPLCLTAIIGTLFLASCSDIQKPKTEPFLADNTPPAVQEFRWSNGRIPKSFDPARAAAPPETDIVRAIFEGLTEIDSRTLKVMPASAESWTSSDNDRVWTFNIRRDARWSNGKHVTAYDFVMSWKRLATLGDKVAHRELFQNIVGMSSIKTNAQGGEPIDFLRSQANNFPRPSPEPSNMAPLSKKDRGPGSSAETISPKLDEVTPAKQIKEKTGVEAVDDRTLRITLVSPDKDFPKLVANPIFRPIYGDGVEFDSYPLDEEVVTNGAFVVADVDDRGVALDRSDTYWNKSTVKLEHIHFISKDNAESALDAYKKGEIDALTNADFEPLALKLLAPYEDFRHTPHSALNFYEFNTNNPPFSDRRVREALAISIDRQRLTESELEGSTEPATSFLPLVDNQSAELSFDVEKAKQLLEKAGYPGGTGFPHIRLVINRNDTQIRVARVVSKMWKQNLNLETDISVKETSEIEAVRASGEYDLLRRGVVLPTLDESVSMATIFGNGIKPENQQQTQPKGPESDQQAGKPPGMQRSNEKTTLDDQITDQRLEAQSMTRILTEDEAVFVVNAIPLYYPMSYSLVKPYVNGFEMNGLDAPLLKDISINNNWQPNAH